jgi:hypothetical protein
VAVPKLDDEVDAVRDDLERLAAFVSEVAEALLAADLPWAAGFGGLAADLRGGVTALRTLSGPGVPAGKAGLAMLAGRLLRDGRAVADQGNPYRAFERRGTDYLADLEQVRLDALLVALGLRPSPPLAVGTLISFRMWAELATWDERRRLALAGLHGLDRVQDRSRDLAVDTLHRATAWLRSELDGRLGRGDAGPVFVPPPLPLPRPLRTAAEGALDRVDAAADEVDHLADRAAGAARTVARAVGAAADHLPWNH